MSTNLDQFQKQNYLNIETFRKNGQGIKTPVWFVQDGSVLYVRTGADSGKVKRIRNNAQIQIAPCKMDGTPLGEWVPANGKEITDPDTDKLVDRLLGKKYGFRNSLFAWMGKTRGDQNTIMKIEIIN
jgi:uncharacterized protein